MTSFNFREHVLGLWMELELNPREDAFWQTMQTSWLMSAPLEYIDLTRSNIGNDAIVHGKILTINYEKFVLQRINMQRLLQLD